MTIHVFVGAGPANLHRALKIAKMDPSAQLIFIDKRLRPETVDFDRQKSRSNIFLFDSEMATKLINDGLDQQAWDAIAYKRLFGLEKDVTPAGPSQTTTQKKYFHMIQIRDLQQLLLNTLASWFQKTPKKLLLLDQEIDLTQGDDAIPGQVMALLEKNKSIRESDAEVTIHVATGALSNDNKKAAIHYPPKAHRAHLAASPDLEAMPLVPQHVTSTFNITENNITCAQLEKAQQSLTTNPDWRIFLKKHGWDLIRPPSIRVFYTNDILYVAAEVPAKITDIQDKNIRERDAILYTQTLAQLVFPGIPVDSLTTNPGSGVTFETQRGERGQISHATTIKQKDDRTIHINLINHGDNRYLPHYQTASGFVIAMLQNNLYAEIYSDSHQTFHDLFLWAQKNKLIALEKSEETVLKQYQQIIDEKNTAPRDALILQAFQAELLNAASKDIIEANKEKIAGYFNGLHRQELTALAKTLPHILEIYNTHQKTTLKETYFKGIEPAAVVIDLLKTNNIDFLRAIMPSILNKNFEHTPADELLQLRDVHVQDYERVFAENKTAIRSHGLTANILYLSKQSPEDVSRIMEQVALYLEQHKAIHHRAAFSFFKGLHSDTVHKFAQEITTLRDAHDPSTKNKMIDALIRLHSTLEAGHSKRTILALQEAIDMTTNQVPGMKMPNK